VDKIRSIVFENKTYRASPWDRHHFSMGLPHRNERDPGQRQQGDWDSGERRGLRQGARKRLNWYDRAFVVKDWYLSAYDRFTI